MQEKVLQGSWSQLPLDPTMHARSSPFIQWPLGQVGPQRKGQGHGRLPFQPGSSPAGLTRHQQPKGT